MGVFFVSLSLTVQVRISQDKKSSATSDAECLQSSSFLFRMVVIAMDGKRSDVIGWFWSRVATPMWIFLWDWPFGLEHESLSIYWKIELWFWLLIRINKIFCFEGSDGVPVHSGRPGKGDPEVRRRAAVSLPAQTGSLHIFIKRI